MELFSVTCTTCQQRLKLRDESAIGEIQICPKCGSMVLIQPPPGSPADAYETPPIASEKSTPPSSPPPSVADAEFEGGHADASDVDGGNSESGDGEEGDSIPVETPRGEAAASATQSPPGLPPHDEQGRIAPTTHDGEEVTDDPSLSASSESVEITQNRYRLLGVGAAALAGIALAFGVFGFVASRAFTSHRSKAPASPQDDAVIETSVEGEELAEAAESEHQSTPDESDAETTEEATGKTPAATQGTNEPASEKPAPEEPASDEPAPEPSDAPQAELPAKDLAGGELEIPPATMGDAGDPEGSDDEQTESAGPSEALAERPAVADSPATSMAESLDTFAPFIDPQAFVPTPGAPPPIQENLPELEPDEGGDEMRDVPRPEPREVDVPQRLADTIPSIEFRDVPIKAFVRFLMGFSTIPMTLDPDALALVGVTSETPVNVHQMDTTVGRTLAEAIQPLRLGFQVVGDQILITRVPAANAPLRTYAHPVDDLVDGDPTRLNELADMIVDMVEPDSWEALGGEGTIHPEMPSLVIQQRETGLFRAILFCERLRAARGLPPRSKFDRSLFELEPRFVRVTEMLRRPVTLNYIEPTSFVQIVDQLSDESGLQILIDWRELADLGWNPAAETTVSANAEPVGEVLSDVLRPMELTYRVVGPTCVQVTSPAQLQTHLDVEFYPAADLLSAELTPDELLKRIRAELGEQMLDELGATLSYDLPSGFLVAALPQPLQRRVFALLEECRTKG